MVDIMVSRHIRIQAAIPTAIFKLLTRQICFIWCNYPCKVESCGLKKGHKTWYTYGQMAKQLCQVRQVQLTSYVDLNNVHIMKQF